MSDIWVLVLIAVSVVGQFAVITLARRRSMFKDRTDVAKDRSDLIEKEAEKQEERLLNK